MRSPARSENAAHVRYLSQKGRHRGWLGRRRVVVDPEAEVTLGRHRYRGRTIFTMGRPRVRGIPVMTSLRGQLAMETARSWEERFRAGGRAGDEARGCEDRAPPSHHFGVGRPIMGDDKRSIYNRNGLGHRLGKRPACWWSTYGGLRPEIAAGRNLDSQVAAINKLITTARKRTCRSSSRSSATTQSARRRRLGPRKRPASRAQAGSDRAEHARASAAHTRICCW